MLYYVFLLQEFIEQFRVLLPKDASSPEEILTLLQNLDLDPKTYQIGKTKVSFLSVLHHQAVQKRDGVQYKAHEEIFGLRLSVHK